MHVSIMLLILVGVAVCIVGAGTWALLSRMGSATSGASPAVYARQGATTHWEPERVFVYALALAGLIAAAYGTAGMLATFVASVTQYSGSSITHTNVQDRTSYYLASLIVGLPIWLGLWLQAQRRAAHLPAEQQAPERRLYFGLLFGGASVTALFGFHTVLRVILTVPGTSGIDQTILVRAGIFAGARMAVWTAIWLFHARLRRAEKIPDVRDGAHDLGIFSLAGFSLAFLVIGGYEAGHRLLQLLVDGQSVSGAQAWMEWGGIAAWIVSGALVWTAIWLHDLRRRGLHPVRIWHLRLVVVLSAVVTLYSAELLFQGTLSNMLGRSTTADWTFLIDSVPVVVLGLAGWAYHWIVVRQQAVYAEEAGIPRDTIPWPRRPLIVLLAFGCLAAASVALASLTWLLIDGIVGSAHNGGGTWWHDRVSTALPALVIEGGIWVAAWSIAQHAARRDPGVEASTKARQRYLGAVAVMSTLTAVGFAVALAVVLFQALLGDGLNAQSVSRCLKDLVTIVLALVVAGYHGSILRRERPLRTRRRTLRLLALIAPEADDTLAELDRLQGRTVEVIGYLTASGGGASVPVPDLEEHLHDLEAGSRATGALLYVYPDGVTVVPFRRSTLPESATRAAPINALPSEEQPALPT